jgi:hypothetical protein
VDFFTRNIRGFGQVQTRDLGEHLKRKHKRFIVADKMFLQVVRSLWLLLQTQSSANKICFKIVILIPCTIEYAEINQQNALNYILLYFSYDGSFMFRQNSAIIRERLCSFLSHFSVNMVEDKS